MDDDSPPLDRPDGILDAILRRTGTVDEQGMVDLYDRALNVLLVIDFEFQRRFPKRYDQMQREDEK